MKTSDTYDVIIAGGGVAGLTLACLLGRVKGLRVACVDRDSPQQQLAQDERTTAISYGSSRILEQAGVWADLQKQGCPIEDIEILDGASPVLLQFLSREVEGKAFGWILSNRDIRQALMAKMAALPGVTHIAPAKIKDFNVGEKAASVILEDGRTLSAALVVGADGRNSLVRDFMDVPVRRWSYRQQAVVCFVAHEHPHKNIAVEHFHAQGPFAILPMSDLADGRHCSSLVYTEHTGRAGSLMDLSAGEFKASVAQRFPQRYGAVEIVADKRMVYPLNFAHAAHYIAPRMALVADAAHAIHPVAGQGLNLGLRDLSVLADLVRAAKDQGQDVGGQALLEAYQRKRRPDNVAMAAFTDGIVRLFSTDFGPVRGLRTMGLKAVSRLPMAKRFFMRKAMGE